MGVRLAQNLAKSAYDVRYVEVAAEGRERLKSTVGVDCSEVQDALRDIDAVILAVPDNAIGKVAASIGDRLPAGSMLIVLDAAAPYAGEMPRRGDVTYFIAHPCHTSMFNEETDTAARMDYFGGIAAKQNIICCLMQGPESDFAIGADIARAFYAPVLKVHRATVEQMIMLEPVLSETVTATCLTIMREAVDEAVKRGVPWDMARDFVLGHMFAESSIIFEQVKGVRMSDGCLKAIELSKQVMFTRDWKRIFEPDAIRESVNAIVRPS
ncbi:MAG: NAD(P)-binding domain-containing protein [Tagaea sp.]|nr:NAD(P)-binding domain-containing protein [Tagaea sp.]